MWTNSCTESRIPGTSSAPRKACSSSTSRRAAVAPSSSTSLTCPTRSACTIRVSTRFCSRNVVGSSSRWSLPGAGTYGTNFRTGVGTPSSSAPAPRWATLARAGRTLHRVAERTPDAAIPARPGCRGRGSCRYGRGVHRKHSTFSASTPSGTEPAMRCGSTRDHAHQFSGHLCQQSGRGVLAPPSRSTATSMNHTLVASGKSRSNRLKTFRSGRTITNRTSSGAPPERSGATDYAATTRDRVFTEPV